MIVFEQRQFAAFQKLTYQLTGVNIADSRRSMLASRVGGRMRAVGIANVDTYYELVTSDTAEQTRFIDRITTHETYFFRTSRVWEYLENRFLPQQHSAHPHRECRVWSAASSSGEEAYSAAMVMHEFQRLNPGFEFSVHGSDISADSVEKCRRGIYRGRTIKRLVEARPEFFKRYLAGTTDAHEIVGSLKKHVTFGVHNLFDKSAATQPYDLILCRNVLIYFQRNDQERVLSNLVDALAPEGKLVIGESEHLPPQHSHFEPVEPLVYQFTRQTPREMTAPEQVA